MGLHPVEACGPETQMFAEPRIRLAQRLRFEDADPNPARFARLEKSAVFQDADGRWDLVDWKTGRRPSGAQLRSRAVQLAVYRLAWSRLKNVPLEDVRAAFFYVADNEIVRPHDLASAGQLEEMVAAAFTA